jgi:gliding motility-associated-like protein
LSIHPKPVFSASGSTVCQTQTLNLTASSSNPNLSYSWIGANLLFTQNNFSLANPPVSMTGNYTVTVVDQLGCIDRATVHASVTAMPSPAFTSNTPRCVGQSLVFNSSSTTGAVQFAWQGPNNFFSSVANPTLINSQVAATGIYTLITTTGPCVRSATAAVIVNALPTLTLSGNNSACETKSVSLTINAPSSVIIYQWVGPNAFAHNQPGFVLDSVKVASAGIYTAVVTDTNLCTSSATTAVSIYTNPVISVKDVTVCLNEPAIFLATGAASYSWQGASWFVGSGPSITITSASAVLPQKYSVTGSALNSCTHQANAWLYTLPLPAPSITASPSASICLNDEYSLRGSGGTGYYWRGPADLYFQGAQITIRMQSKSMAGSYTLTVSDTNNCKASVSTDIYIHDLPDGYLIPSVPAACVPFCSNFTFAPTQSNSVTAYWMYDKVRFEGSSFRTCFTESGTKFIKGYLYDSKTECRNIVDFSVEAYPKPLSDFRFYPELPVEDLDEVQFTNLSEGEGIKSFKWSFPPQSAGDKVLTAYTPDVLHLFADAGKFAVALVTENNWGCKDTMVRTIQVLEDFNLYVPNAFTPNEDARNELFTAQGRGVRKFNLKVYDRWGALVFESNDLQQGWDGTYRGEVCKSDVYTWIITASSNKGDIKTLNGHVTLFR